jgi:uncharacterized protein
MTDKDTLIEFPCDFPIKIFGKNDASFIKAIVDIARKYYPDLKDDSIKQQESKKAQYISLTITVFAKDKKTLDSLYVALSEHPDTKMVL